MVVAFFYFLKTNNLNRIKIILVRFNTNTQTLTLPLCFTVTTRDLNKYNESYTFTTVSMLLHLIAIRLS